MRSALLISGNPRFSVLFDQQLEFLKNSEIDWYISFWRRNIGEDIKISSNWYKLDSPHKVRDALEPILPKGHRIITVSFLNPAQFSIPREFEYFQQPPWQIWQQYCILKHCDQRRQTSGINYDLVIRSRSDIGLLQSIDLQAALNYLRSHPKKILTPSNLQHGDYYPSLANFCDQFAIGLPDAMIAYSRSIDLFDEMEADGVLFQPESLIQHSIYRQGFENTPDDNIRISSTLYNHPLDHGNWASLRSKNTNPVNNLWESF